MDSLEINKDWLSKFEGYRNWYTSLERRSRTGEVSAIMRSNYDAVLKQFMTFCNFKKGQSETITPDSIIEWAKEADPNHIIDLLNSFEKWIQGKEAEGYEKRVLVRNERFVNQNTARQKAHGIARGYLSHNAVWVPKGRKVSGVVPKTKTNDVNYAVFKFDSGAGLIVQDYSQFRYFLSNLSFRDQTVGLCLLSTSQDIGNLLELTIGFVREQNGRDRLYWSGNRLKTGELFKTFFSKEATRYLRQYIAQEREGADPNEPIFVRTGGSKRPLLQRNVASNFKDVAKKMGIDNGDAQNPFRPKRLRSIFSTACYQAKIDDGARHIFQGHASTVSERYREIPVANLEAMYAQLEPFVTVYADDRSREVSESISMSRTAISKVEEQSAEITQLKTQLDELGKELVEMKQWSDGAFQGATHWMHEALRYMPHEKLIETLKKIGKEQIVTHRTTEQIMDEFSKILDERLGNKRDKQE